MSAETEKEVRDLLLSAPETQLDPALFPLIEKWNFPPTSLQILEALDMCVYGGAASGFTVTVLEGLLNRSLRRDGQELKDIIPYATWRSTY